MLSPKSIWSRSSIAAVSLFAASGVLGCENPAKRAEQKPEPAPVAAAPTAPAKPAFNINMVASFKPALPKEFENKEDPVTEEKVSLGRMLYFDKRLSRSQVLSCNSCHQLDKYGVDGEKTSVGHKGQRGTRNSPTVYNAAGHFVQFWDGRSPDVEHQATGPMMNPVEMALPDEPAARKVLSSMPEYVAAFKKAFPEDKDPVSLKNAGRAMGAFERRLVTPSPWDKLLEGDEKALTDEQKEGFMAFLSNGCVACHTGTLLGGTTYQKVGAVQPWPNQTDQGRFEVTRNEADKMMFKVPSLRNITETAPYFHDASAASLEEAIKKMGKHQLGRDISDADVKSIVAFFGALKGELPSEYIKEPELPKSTSTTPQADLN